MKKTAFAVAAFMVIFSIPLFSESFTGTPVYSVYSESHDENFLSAMSDSKGKSDKTISLDSFGKKVEGKGKLGISAGYPTGITFGYQTTRLLEINVTAGLFPFDQLLLGASALFTLADIEISDEYFPLSFGPALYVRSGRKTRADLLGVLRLEYTFEDSPVNIFIEGGAGMEIMPDIGFSGSGALGIRYVF